MFVADLRRSLPLCLMVVSAVLLAGCGRGPSAAVSLPRSPTRQATAPTITPTTPAPAATCPPPRALPPAPAALPAVTDLAVNDLSPNESGIVTTVGGRRHQLTGSVGPIPVGLQLWVMTSPPSTDNSYLQGRVIPDASGRWRVAVNVGKTNEQIPKFPDPVTVMAVADAVGAYFVSCRGTIDDNPVIPTAVLSHVRAVARISIHKVAS